STLAGALTIFRVTSFTCPLLKTGTWSGRVTVMLAKPSVTMSGTTAWISVGVLFADGFTVTCSAGFPGIVKVTRRSWGDWPKLVNRVPVRMTSGRTALVAASIGKATLTVLICGAVEKGVTGA